MSTPKKIAATIMLASSILGAVSFTVVAAGEIGKLYDHPLVKLKAARQARKIAKGFDPNKAAW